MEWVTQGAGEMGAFSKGGGLQGHAGPEFGNSLAPAGILNWRPPEGPFTTSMNPCGKDLENLHQEGQELPDLTII